MKQFRSIAFFVLLSFVTMLQSCRKETEPRPLADINQLAGKWTNLNNTNEFVFDPSTRSGTYTRVAPNANGFKVGDVTLKNVEATDEKTFRGEMLYRGTDGYFLYTDITFTLKDDRISYAAYLGTLGLINVSGQKGEFKRAN